VAFINVRAQQLSGGQGGLPFPPLPPIPGMVEASDERVTGEINLPRLSFKGSLDNMTLNWNTQPGARYQVQTSTDLKGWTNVGELRTAVGASDSIGIEANGKAVFYRVLRLP
jgi:hypothetical protein